MTLEMGLNKSLRKTTERDKSGSEFGDFFSILDALIVHGLQLNCAYVLNDAWNLKSRKRA